MTQLQAVSSARVRRAIPIVLVALVVVPLVWQLGFNSGHGTGHSGYGRISTGH